MASLAAFTSRNAQADTFWYHSCSLTLAVTWSIVFWLVYRHTQSYWTWVCLFLSVQLLDAAIFLVRLLETLSCFLITYFIFIWVCIEYLCQTYRSIVLFLVGISSNGRNIVKRSDCGFFGRIMIKPTDCSLSISISTLFCLSVFLVQMCCFGHLQQRIHISRQSVITNIVKVLYGFVSVTNL